MPYDAKEDLFVLRRTVRSPITGRCYYQWASHDAKWDMECWTSDRIDARIMLKEEAEALREEERNRVGAPPYIEYYTLMSLKDEIFSRQRIPA